jgi:hypothetical protein
MNLLRLKSKARVFSGIFGALLLALAAASVANAQIALQPNLVLRAVTPGDIAKYKLPSTTDVSGGLMNIGIGQPAYLDLQINNAEPASDIQGVTWVLTTRPAGSAAAIMMSPLTPNVPAFEPSDRLVAQVAGRALLRPDVVGEYLVTATVTTGSNGSATVAQTIFAATYVGISACSNCHDGTSGTLDQVAPWTQTLHANVFKDGVTGVFAQTIDYMSYPTTCYPCHTVGYDVNATQANGGFSSLATQFGWTVPSNLSLAAWNDMPASLQNVANIQCENCHGAGSIHAESGGTPFEITVPTGSGSCAQCHDEPSSHVKFAEWSNSMHAVTTTDPAGNATCVGCHTSNGYIGRMTGATTVNTTYNAINCEGCHEPHGQTTPASDSHLIRNMAPVKLADGTTVSTAGMGSLCITCHQAREAAATYAATTAGSAHFGPHEGPQGDMLQGANGFTYGQTIPSSPHIFAVTDTCVTCHMQTVASTAPGFLLAGDHTFEISFTPAGSTTPQELVAACQVCHGPSITTFDMPISAFGGSGGSTAGVQTDVQNLLNQLSTLLPPVGTAKTSLSIDATWTQPQLEAAYNWLFVNNDGSLGIHNAAYAEGLLNASIANLKTPAAARK